MVIKHKFPDNLAKNKNNSEKILVNHLDFNAKALKQLGDDVALAKHSVNLGNAREGLITNFLKQNLPNNIEYHSGELCDRKGCRSGQIDIILHPNLSPKINLYNTINIFPVETVLAIIEVKSSLDKRSLTKAMESCFKVKNLEIKRNLDSYGEDISVNMRHNLEYVPYIVFAYKGGCEKTIRNHIFDCCLR